MTACTHLRGCNVAALLVRPLAVAALLLFLWSLLRLALGPRAMRAAREEERHIQEATGCRVVAERSLDERVVLWLEDRDGFYWAGHGMRKRHLRDGVNHETARRVFEAEHAVCAGPH